MTRRWSARLTALIVFAAIALPALAQDYAREARWQAEVLGNLVVGDAVHIPAASGRTFLGLNTEGSAGRPAVLIVHGIGVHPDHGVIGSLRVALADMGFTTLSIQMPVLAADAKSEDYHPALFPDAAQRIAAAADWLRGHGHKRIVLVSHSLGSWMSEYYFETAKRSAFAGWACLGRGGELRLTGLAIPVLDVYGEQDLPAVLKSAAARRAALARIPGSSQVMIAGADHFYTGKEEELARVLRKFILGLLAEDPRS